MAGAAGFSAARPPGPAQLRRRWRHPCLPRAAAAGAPTDRGRSV